MKLRHLLHGSQQSINESMKKQDKINKMKCPCGNSMKKGMDPWWPVERVLGIGGRVCGFIDYQGTYSAFQCLICGRIINLDDSSVLRGPTKNRSFDTFNRPDLPGPSDPVIGESLGESLDFEFAPRYDSTNGPEYRKCPKCGDMMVGVKEIRGIGDRLSGWEIGDEDEERLDFSNGVACIDCGLVAEPQEPYRIIGRIPLREDAKSDDYKSTIIPKGTVFISSLPEDDVPRFIIDGRRFTVEDSYDTTNANDGTVAVVMMMYMHGNEHYDERWLLGVYYPDRGIGNRIIADDGPKEIYYGRFASFRASIIKTFNSYMRHRINPDAVNSFDMMLVQNEGYLNDHAPITEDAEVNQESLYFPSGTVFKPSYDEGDIAHRFLVVRSYDHEDENGDITVAMLVRVMAHDGTPIEWSISTHPIERGVGNRQIIPSRNIGIQRSHGNRHRKPVERFFDHSLKFKQNPLPPLTTEPYFKWDKIS